MNSTRVTAGQGSTENDPSSLSCAAVEVRQRIAADSCVAPATYSRCNDDTYLGRDLLAVHGETAVA